MPSERAMKTNIILEYLDGSLASEQMSEVEGLIEGDPQVCTLLDRHDKLETFISRLQEALSMPPFPAERDCPNDGSLRRAVTAQIQAPTPGDETAAFNVNDPSVSTDSQALVTPPPDGIAFLSPPQGAGELGRLNGYRILRLLGQGGMGMVFEAEDIRLKRRIALKAMKPEIAAKEEHRVRFLREAQTAAAVEHDFICPIYQVGEENGVPFIAMPFLKGEPLDMRLKRRKKLPIAEAIRIVCEVAEGLAAAHKEGLIHRDIKPANIWLESLANGRSRCRILDFGLARTITDDVHLTQSGAIMGTPAYMAPEQARARPVDHRADLFSLGVILYEMTTGRRPFTGSDTMSILTSLAIDDPTAPNLINAAIPAELSDLTMRLLSKPPENRPASGRAVAEALLGALVKTSKPIVEAMPASAAPSPGTAVDLTAVDPWQGIDDPAATEAIVATARQKHKAAPSKEQTKRLQTRKSPTSHFRSRAGWGILVASLLVLIGGAFATYKLAFETRDGTLHVEVDGDADVRFKNGELQIFDADGKLKYKLAPSEKNKTLRPGKYLVKIVGADGVRLESPEFIMEKKGTASVRVVAVATKEKLPPIVGAPNHPKTAAKVEFLYALPWVDEQQGFAAHLWQTDISQDGKLFFACGDTGPKAPIRVCDTATGKQVQVLMPGGEAWWTLAKFLHENRVVACYAKLNDLYLYDIKSGSVMRRFVGHEKPESEQDSGLGFAVSADGKRILSWSNDKTLRLWDVETGVEIRRFEGHADKAMGVFSPDGKQILTFSPDKTLRLWNVETGKELKKMEGHADAVRFTPNGKQALSFSYDGTIHLWELATGTKIHQFEGPDHVNAANFAADGRLVVAVPDAGKSARKNLCIWETKSGKLLREIDLTRFGPEGSSFTATPDGRQGLVCDGGSVHVIDLVTGDETHLFADCPMARAFSFSPDGRTVVAGSFRRGVFVFRLGTPPAEGGWNLGGK